MRYLIGVAALLSLAGTAPAQWGSGSGPPPGPVGPFIRVQTGAAPFQPVPLPPTYEWHVSKSNPDRLNLWCDGQNIGAFWESSSTYHRFVGPGWSDPREPPIALPGSRRAITQNFGLDLSKINPPLDGHPLTKPYQPSLW